MGQELRSLSWTLRTPIPQPRQGCGRKIEWRVSRKTHFRFQELLTRLLELELESQRSPEVRAETAAVQEEIRGLPGYPKRYHPENDLIVPVVTTEQR